MTLQNLPVSQMYYYYYYDLVENFPTILSENHQVTNLHSHVMPKSITLTIPN